MTIRQLMSVAATVHSGQPRLAYRNQPADTWTMVTVDPVSVHYGDGGQLMRTDYDVGLDLMRALLFDTPYFDPRDSLDVEAGDDLLRARTVDVYQLPVEIADDGHLLDVKELLQLVSATSGQPMRAERAVRELDAAPTDFDAKIPTPVAGVAADTAHVQVATGFDEVPMGGGRTYRPRTLFGMPDVQFLQRLRRMSGHARLSGPPGAGKTSAVLAAFGDDVLSVQGHPDLTVAALCGQYLPVPSEHGTQWQWVDGPLTRAMREGKVLLFDEINRAPKDVDDVLLPTVDQRRQLVLSDRPDLPPITAAPGFMVVATLNDLDTGIRPLSAALRRRLNIHVRVDTDYGIAAERGIDGRLLRVAQNLRTSGVDFGRQHNCDPSWYPQMADLEGAATMLEFGAQASFTALTASTDDRGRLQEAAQVFASVFGEQVRPVAELGV